MRQNWLIATFLIWFILILAFAVWTSSGNGPITPGEPQFQVREGDRLFFRNLRMSEYFLEEDSASGFEVMTHKDLRDSELQLSIVWNWRNDEAYLYLYQLDSCVESVELNGVLSAVKDLDTEQAWYLGVDLYNQLLATDTVVVNSMCHDPLFLTPESKWSKATKQTLKDYFKLVHQLP